MAQEQNTSDLQAQERNAPGRGGNMALTNAGEGSSRRISPIWVLIGLTVIGVGIVFGQALVSPSASAQAAAAHTPAPTVTEPAYGAGAHLIATASPSTSPLPAARPYYVGSPGTPSPQYIDPRSVYDTTTQEVLHNVMTAQVPPAGSTVSTSAVTISSSQIVQVYSDDGVKVAPTPEGVTLANVQGSPPPQEVTTAGDMQGTEQGTLVQGSGSGQFHFGSIPDVITTPMPYMVPAGTGIRAQFDMPVDSDLPGDVRIHVLQGYCDPRNGGLVIPPDSEILGRVKRLASDRHLDFTWYRFTYPDLSSRPLMDIATLDEEGHDGVAGRKNTHSWQIFRDSFFASIANEAGSILNTAVSHTNGSTVTVQAPGQQQNGNGFQQNYVPTVEIARSTPLTIYLEADFGADRPYNLPGWHGCAN